MLRQIILLLSFIQLMQCISTRSNIWWSRRSDGAPQDCDIALDYENPSLEAKICGYCFALCQQRLANCLLAQISKSEGGSIEYCQERSNRCEQRCLADKRTSRIAEANWMKVVRVLQELHSMSPMKSEH